MVTKVSYFGGTFFPFNPLPPRGVLAPPYRGPSGETWAGRGAKPRWLVDAIKDGKMIDKSAGKGRRLKGSNSGMHPIEGDELTGRSDDT
jgi:hypothetical protein